MIFCVSISWIFIFQNFFKHFLFQLWPKPFIIRGFMAVSFFQSFYEVLFTREKRNGWCSGGKAGIGIAAQRLLSKYRSNGKANGRVPQRGLKRHPEYLAAKAQVKRNFAKANSDFEKLLPNRLSYRNRVLVISFLERILLHERSVIPSLHGILKSDNCNWETIVELEKSWKKTKKPSTWFSSFLLNAWSTLDGKNGNFLSFKLVVSCEPHAGQRYVDLVWWQKLEELTGEQCRDWLDPYPRGCTWKDALSYAWWGQDYLNPPWRKWSATWKYAKLQMQQGNVGKMVLVIPNSSWSGYGNVGFPSAWCQEVKLLVQQDKAVAFQTAYGFTDQNGTKFKKLNIWCVLVKSCTWIQKLKINVLQFDDFLGYKKRKF